MIFKQIIPLKDGDIAALMDDGTLWICSGEHISKVDVDTAMINAQWWRVPTPSEEYEKVRNVTWLTGTGALPRHE